MTLRLLRPDPFRVEAVSALMPPSVDHDLLLLSAIRDMSEQKTLVMLWTGGAIYYNFLLMEPPGFDFVLSRQAAGEVDLSRPVLAEALVEEVLKETAGHLRRFLKSVLELGELGPARIIVAATPPPKGDYNFIREVIAREFDEDAVARVSPPSLMLKLWYLEMALKKEVVLDLGLEFLEFPLECQDEFGFLDRKFYQNDCTHANMVWGEAFLAHLFEYLGLES